LPTEEARSKSQSFGVEDKIRFLDLDGDENSVEYQEWSFLEQFGVCCKADLSFHLEALDALFELDRGDNSVMDPVVAIYKSIGSIAQLQDRREVKVRCPTGVVMGPFWHPTKSVGRNSSREKRSFTPRKNGLGWVIAFGTGRTFCRTRWC
jgi:hypothetical protein